MKFISTTGKGPEISFRAAVLGNLPDDGGLYFPAQIPSLEQDFLNQLSEMDLDEMAAHALWKFCGDDIDRSTLSGITRRVFNFPIPVKEVETDIHCLELFHGPTYAFKDIGAKFLAECLSHFNKDDRQERTVLVATSGDTGGAVANGFWGVEGVRVIILYPKGKVSELQEKQLTTLGKNITALEVDGTFDDCQAMVKMAFADDKVNAQLPLSSANSINVARWLPQSIYYYIPFHLGFRNSTIAVPSGNYGNLTSGVLAQKMGIPIRGFIAASNANDTVPRYLKSGSYEPRETIPTVANAMDVADPSNFTRLQSLYHGSYREITDYMTPFTLSDQEIRETINTCKELNEYVLDPHSAIAYEALKDQEGGGIFLGTAHHCKFLPTINESLGEEVDVPEFALALMSKQKVAIPMKADYSELQQLLLD